MSRALAVLAVAFVLVGGCSRRSSGDVFDEPAGPEGAGGSVGAKAGGGGAQGGGGRRAEAEVPVGEQLGGFVFTETVGGRVERRITAERMTTGEGGEFHLEEMSVEYFPPDGVYSVATAAEGVYDEASQELLMRGDARLKVAWGASLAAPLLQWDRRADVITAPSGARLRYGSRTFMVADRLEARPSLGRVEMWEASGSVHTDDMVGPGKGSDETGTVSDGASTRL